MQKKIDLETHCLIIGGGPAGSTLARELSKNSIKTILVEKNRSNDKPCGGGVKSIIFEEFNIPKNLESKRINKFDLFSKKSHVTMNLKNSTLSIVLRKDFDEKLRLLAQDEGTKIIEAKYKNSQIFEDYVISTIILKNKKEILIKSKYLIGADGVKSTVRKKLFKSRVNSLLTRYTLIKSNKLDRCKFYFGKKFSLNEYTWIFPHKDKISFGSVLNNNKNSEELFKNFINENIEYNNEKIKGFYIPLWKKNDIFYENRVFLVGDCAGQVLPFTYEGIYYVMKSAKILADAIIKGKPELYKTNWNKNYKKRFKFYKQSQKLFLSYNFMTNIMIKFFKNEKLQNKALKYWEGTRTIPKISSFFLKTLKYSFSKKN